MPPDLRRFIEQSLGALEREAPAFHLPLCATMRGRRLSVAGDGDPFALCFDASVVSSADTDGSEDVHLRVGNRTLLALVDGELSLEAALREDSLELRGRVTHVANTFDALQIYVRGVIRCPSQPQLLTTFRASTSLPSSEVPR